MILLSSLSVGPGSSTYRLGGSVNHCMKIQGDEGDKGT